MNTADALYQARQCEALASAAERALERLCASLGGDDGAAQLVDVTRIRRDDAKRLAENAHWIASTLVDLCEEIVRQLEALGAGAPQ